MTHPITADLVLSDPAVMALHLRLLQEAPPLLEMPRANNWPRWPRRRGGARPARFTPPGLDGVAVRSRELGSDAPLDRCALLCLRLSSALKSSSLRTMSAAATFSSRCLTLPVPGMGSITGLRFSTQASAICAGVALCFLAMPSSSEPGLARSPAASGNQGMNPIPCFSQ